jgi:hypothetical protein
MKTFKTICTVALALGVTAVAQAQTNVYITGSTAFRPQIFQALTDMGLASQQGLTSGANSFTCTGTINPTIAALLTSISNDVPSLLSNSVTVYCNFSGSAEGVDALIHPVSAGYISVGTTGTFSHTGDDFAFSDVWQAVTPDPTPTLEEVQSLFDQTNLPFAGIAVQPFTFVENSAAASLGINNISCFAFEQLFGNGVYTANFLGAANTSNVIAVGRYPLSGTRITSVLDDNPYTALPSQTLKQWALSTNGTANPVNCPGLASTDGSSPPTTGATWVSVLNSDHADYPQGDGYFSGGNVGKAIHASSLQNLGAAIAYISWGDAAKISAGTGALGEGPISWNGVASWNGGTYPAANGTNYWNNTGLVDGDYQFWGYEHFYVAAGDNNTWYDNTFGPGLVDAIQYELVNTTPRIAELESEMQVYRTADGAPVYHK